MELRLSTLRSRERGRETEKARVTIRNTRRLDSGCCMKSLKWWALFRVILLHFKLVGFI